MAFGQVPSQPYRCTFIRYHMENVPIFKSMSSISVHIINNTTYIDISWSSVTLRYFVSKKALKQPKDHVTWPLSRNFSFWDVRNTEILKLVL